MTEAHMNVNGKDICYVDEDDLTEIESLDQIPNFGSEAEAQVFWDTHTLSSAFWRMGGPQAEEIQRATNAILAKNGRRQKV